MKTCLCANCGLYSKELKNGLCPICHDEKNGMATCLITMRRQWPAVWADKNMDDAADAFERPFWSAMLFSDAARWYENCGLFQWSAACKFASRERQLAQVQAGVLDPMFL